MPWRKGMNKTVACTKLATYLHFPCQHINIFPNLGCICLLQYQGTSTSAEARQLHVSQIFLQPCRRVNEIRCLLVKCWHGGYRTAATFGVTCRSLFVLCGFAKQTIEIRAAALPPPSSPFHHVHRPLPCRTAGNPVVATNRISALFFIYTDTKYSQGRKRRTNMGA